MDFIDSIKGFQFLGRTYNKIIQIIYTSVNFFRSLNVSNSRFQFFRFGNTGSTFEKHLDIED